MTQKPIRAFAIGLALLSTPALAQAPAQTQPAATAQAPAKLTDPAAKQVKGFYDVLLDAMKRAKTLGVQGRYKLLEPAVDAAFDLQTMTKMIVGPQWDSMSTADRSALVAAFRRMTIANYARNFDGYNGEAFVVDPKVMERAGDKVVSTKMTSPNHGPIPFVYRMAKTDKGWRIIDIFLNGYVSEVATRRADFASTLKEGGPKELTQKLNALSDKALQGQ